MAFKRILTTATAAALIFSPTIAVAARAASPAPAQQVAPAAETIDEGSELRRTGFIIPLAGLILIVLAVLLLTKKDNDPVSP